MSTIVAQTLSNGSVSTSTANCIQGSAKAWVNFNGTGTPAIRASYNVSSITKGSTGQYTVNFTNAFADANYSVTTSGQRNLSGFVRPFVVAIDSSSPPAAMATTYVRLCCTDTQELAEDPLTACISVFR